MKRYEFSEGTSNKFWEIEQAGKKLTVRWGRIGGAPQEKVTTFASPAAATAEHDKLVADKTKKGYQLTKGGKAAAPAKADKPANPTKPAKGGNVAPTTSVRAKGRTHDITGEPAIAVDIAKIEKNIGLPVGPVMRELVELCQATMPSDPSGAFALLGKHGDLDFGCFHSPHTSVGMFMAKKLKRLRAFATDHKDVISFVLGDGTTTDDSPVVYEDVVSVEEPVIIAPDLASYLSQLALAPAPGYTPEDKKDIARLAKNLKTHSAVNAKRAKAQVSDELAMLDLDEAPGTKRDVGDARTAKEGKGRMPSKADIERAKKLQEKANDIKWNRNAKAAIPFAQQALALLEGIPYEHESGWMRTSAEETVLELMVEAKQRAAANELWEQIIDRWSAAGAGSVSWRSIAIAQGALKTKLPPALRDRVRRAWARGRFGNIHEFEGTTDRKLPKKPSKNYPLVDAQVALLHKKIPIARQCLAAARKSDPESKASHDMFEIAVLEVEGKRDEAIAAYKKMLATARASKEWQAWEYFAALAVLFELDDAATKKAISTAWNKQDDEAGSAIFDS